MHLYSIKVPYLKEIRTCTGSQFNTVRHRCHRRVGFCGLILIRETSAVNQRHDRLELINQSPSSSNPRLISSPDHSLSLVIVALISFPHEIEHPDDVHIAWGTSNVPSSWMEMTERCMDRDPTKRPSMVDLAGFGRSRSHDSAASGEQMQIPEGIPRGGWRHRVLSTYAFDSRYLSESKPTQCDCVDQLSLS